MNNTTVSSKYQVVIPKEVRERAAIRPGQKLSVFFKDGAIYLIPVPTLDELQGLAKGISTQGLRDEEDRY